MFVLVLFRFYEYIQVPDLTFELNLNLKLFTICMQYKVHEPLRTTILIIFNADGFIFKRIKIRLIMT